MAYNISEKLQDNIRAIRIALSHQDGKELSPDEVSNLKKFSGFGGIKAILYPYGTQEEWSANGATKEDLKHHAGIMELHDLLKENYSETQYRNIISSLRNSVLTAFYTPQVVPETYILFWQHKTCNPNDCTNLQQVPAFLLVKL